MSESKASSVDYALKMVIAVGQLHLGRLASLLELGDLCIDGAKWREEQELRKCRAIERGFTLLSGGIIGDQRNEGSEVVFRCRFQDTDKLKTWLKANRFDINATCTFGPQGEWGLAYLMEFWTKFDA